MRFLWSLSRVLSRPAALWGLFAIVLAISAGGLAVLSRHALRLSHDQRQSQHRVEQEQNIRVALWRLDSRLGPYIATLHDPLFGSLLNPKVDQFVLQRFRIAPDSGVKGSHFVFSPVASQTDKTPGVEETPDMRSSGGVDHNWKRLTESIAVNDVVAAVDALLPQIALDRDQSLLQSYAVQIPEASSFNERELRTRNEIVQKQVALNTNYAAGNQMGMVEAESSGTIATGDDVKLMSVWVDEQLVVVRSSRTNPGQLEGVWIDWPVLRQSLVEDINDLVPDASLRPVKQSDVIEPARTLAAIPAMVVPSAGTVVLRGWSPTDTALLLAWCAFVISALLAGVALSRLIALSERRATFVSAVTHELRTPLTTFRLYSDLLARDMVQDPTDRKEYLQTLRREADRLTHLVDNVLRYSKLQRRSKRTALETVVLSEWVGRITPRLAARLEASDMTLVVDQQGDGRWSTDPPAIEQVLFNLVDNAAKYAQSARDRRVHLRATIENNIVVFSVSDYGPGVPEALQSTIFRPFAKSAERAAETAAGVGLGLALAKQTAIALGGKLSYRNAEGGGALFQLEIPRGRVD